MVQTVSILVALALLPVPAAAQDHPAVAAAQAEVRATRALVAAASMVRSVGVYTEAIHRVAAERTVSSCDEFRRAISVVVGGNSGRAGSGPGYREITDEVLSDAVRTGNVGDPFIAALLAVSKAAEAAVAIFSVAESRPDAQDSSSGCPDRSSAIDGLDSATGVADAAMVALDIAIQTANAARREAEATADDLARTMASAARREAEAAQVRNTHGYFVNALDRYADAMLNPALRADEFNGIWNRSSRWTEAVAEGTVADRAAFEKLLLERLLSAASSWHYASVGAAEHWLSR